MLVWNIVRMYRNPSKTVVCPSGRLYACHGFSSVTGARKCEILKHDSPSVLLASPTRPTRPVVLQVLGEREDLFGVLHPLGIVAVVRAVLLEPGIHLFIEQFLQILGDLEIQYNTSQ